MAGLYDRLEETAFKQVAGGYVFQTGNPWVIGPQRRYFVNEAQKAEIAECMRQIMGELKPFIIVSLIVLPLVTVAAAFWFIIGLRAPQGTVYLYMGLLSLGIFVPYFAIIHAYRIGRLHPLIAGLPRSDERITWREVTESFAANVSLKFLVMLLVAPVIIFGNVAMNLAVAFVEDRPIPLMDVLMMAFGGLMTAYVTYLLILREKGKRTAS
jgi:hypothetical protein